MRSSRKASTRRASKCRVHLPSIYSETERPMVMTETEKKLKERKKEEYKNNNNSITISSSRSIGNDVGISFSKLLMFQICCTNLFVYSLFEVFFTRVLANVANTHTLTHIGMNWICNGISKHHRHSSKDV